MADMDEAEYWGREAIRNEGTDTTMIIDREYSEDVNTVTYKWVDDEERVHRDGAPAHVLVRINDDYLESTRTTVIFR